MLIERPPRIFRRCFPEALFRVEGDSSSRDVYLTFDDGPIPEATPWVLDTLKAFDAKATFFMVGDNVRRYPELLRRVREEGHSVGNHTMHHLQGIRTPDDKFFADIAEADRLIGSTLFRPPHGWLSRSQAKALSRDYRIVMYDLVTRDYSRRLDAGDVIGNVRKYARPGSIIVFHDSLKSINKLRTALPEAISWLRDEGYSFCRLED